MNTAALLFALLPVQDLDWVYVTTDPMGMDADGANFLDRDPFGFPSVDIDLFDLDPFSEDPLGVVPWGQDPTPFYSSVDPVHSSDPLGNMGVPNYGWGLGNTTGGMAASIGGWDVGIGESSFGMVGGGFGVEMGLDPGASTFYGDFGDTVYGGQGSFGGARGFPGTPYGARGHGPGQPGIDPYGVDGVTGQATYGLGATSILDYSRLLLNRGRETTSTPTAPPRPMLQKADAQNIMDTMLSPVTRRARREAATSPAKPATEPKAGTPAARVHDWFGTLDSNQDGAVDETEFRAGTLLSRHVFQRVDTNRDGQLDVTELQGFLLKK